MKNGTTSPQVPDTGKRAEFWSERRFVVAAWICYVAMVGIVAWTHEPWFDETRSWQLAVTSDGIQALRHNVQYEGHPLLYFLLLKGITYFSRSWMAILAVHVGMAASTAWIVLRFAPFSRLQRLLLVFSYCLAYEFAVFSRPYALGMLLAFGAVAAWCATPRKVWVAGVLLVLLANTSIMGLGLSLSLTAGMLADTYWDGDTKGKSFFSWTTLSILATIVVVVGLMYWQVVPPPDAEYRGSGLLGDVGVTLGSLAWIISLPTRAMMPFQMMTGDLMHWGAWVFSTNARASSLVAMLLSAVIALLWFVLASRRRSGAVIVVCSVIGYSVLFGVIYTGSFRHHGHLAIAWILAVWMAYRGPVNPLPIPALEKLAPFANRRRWLLTIGLLPMTLAYLPAAWSEIRHPFSDARTVARMLEQPDLDSLPILGVAQLWSQSVAALSHKSIHFPSGLVAIVDYRLPHTSAAEIVRGSLSIESQLLQAHCRIVIIRDSRLPYPAPFRTTLLYRTPANSTMANEGTMIVELAHAPPSMRCPAGG